MVQPHHRPAPLDLDEIEGDLLQALTQLWHRGWMPADVMGTIRHLHSSWQAELTRQLIIVEHQHSGYDDRLSPRWYRQLKHLAEQPACPSPLADLTSGVDVTRWSRDTRALQATFTHLPELHRLGPLPGQGTLGSLRVDPGERPLAHAGADPDVLRRVRAMLAKAESTEFAHEADAFTEKAQAMIAAHSLQHVLASIDSNDPTDAPAAIRLAIERPYDREKFTILAAVARANRCRTILHSGLGFATVMGFTVDFGAVELLYTSLLVQATKAMHAYGSTTDWSGRSNTRTFRRSFLQAFASRIGQRLTAATEAASHQAESGPTGRRLTPVLASRSEAVTDALDMAFPNSTRLRSRAQVDGSGWSAGVTAANQADLGRRPPLTS